MKCLNCANLRIQASETHAKHGVAVCIKNKDRGYMSIKYERECGHYEQADAGVVIKRMRWFENIR